VRRTGSFALELRPDGSARSRVTFNDKVANNRRTQEKIEYLLDGPNLIDRTYRTKTQVTRQVLRPGERINLLKLGEGPFPLPIGQDKEEVRRLFEVTKVEPDAEADPPNTVHVRLEPKAGTQFADQFKSIDAWVDLADHMPKRIETLDANGVTLRTTDLSDVRVNEKLGDETFALEKLPEGWTLLNEAYDGR
jgi:outer membrane lipoprotein-sorting protein